MNLILIKYTYTLRIHMNQNYQFFIIKSEKVGLKHYNVLKAFTDYSNHIQDVYKNIDEYNPGKESINRT